MNDQTLETTESMSYPGSAQSADAHEEVLVADPRASLTPAQQVEQKLLHLLRTSPLLVSRLQSNRRTGR